MSNMPPRELNVDSADVPQTLIMDGLKAHKRKMEPDPFAVSPLSPVKLGQHFNQSQVLKSNIFQRMLFTTGNISVGGFCDRTSSAILIFGLSLHQSCRNHFYSLLPQQIAIKKCSSSFAVRAGSSDNKLMLLFHCMSLTACIRKNGVSVGFMAPSASNKWRKMSAWFSCPVIPLHFCKNITALRGLCLAPRLCVTV